MIEQILAKEEDTLTSWRLLFAVEPYTGTHPHLSLFQIKTSASSHGSKEKIKYSTRMVLTRKLRDREK